MKNTIEALAELRAHWKSSGCPSIANIAKRANIPSATAHRYLSGATKGGMAETIRALAIAMDRRDIAESIPYTGIGNEDYIVELSQQWNEKFNQQLAEVTAKHKQELEDLIRDHRLERDDWHTLRKALHQENVHLRESFDRVTAEHCSLLKTQRREKWIAYALFIGASLLLVFK